VTSPRLRRPQNIPDAPGCYLFKDGSGRAIYVGKAKSLRSRLGSYFQADHLLHPRTLSMVELATDVEWIVTNNEVESLHLEYNLIKSHAPRFNVRYRDDKSYPYLAITIGDDVPRAMVMRGRKRKEVRYFGPYAHAYAIRETLDLILRTFPMRTCSQGVFDRARRIDRACLLYDIGKCSGPCVQHVDKAQHRAIVQELIAFMDGNHDAVLDRLDKQMHEASTALEFERAARLRDQLTSVRTAIEKQVVVSDRNEHFDLIGLVEDDLEAALQVFFVRGGRMVGRKGFVVDKVEDLDPPALMSRFLLDLYMAEDEIPREILVPAIPEDEEALAQLLAEKRGGPVRFRVPQRGEKRALADTATNNAGEAFTRHKLKRRSDFAARARQLNSLQEALDLPEAPLRIECFDISNLGPSEKVASMVVFEDGLPKKSDYRRFAIRTVEGQDDFASMREVITRRFTALLQERAGEREKPGKFAYQPNLVVIDGGRGQLNAALGAVADLGVADLTIVGLAKRFEEVYVPEREEPIRIQRGSEALYLLQHVRDEAHRFAITYHRTLRSKKTTQSALDRVPGVGPTRKRALLRRFGSVRRILDATEQELSEIVPADVVRRLQAVLRGLERGKAD
jgi:excinuclease ABC subunit C